MYAPITVSWDGKDRNKDPGTNTLPRAELSQGLSLRNFLLGHALPGAFLSWDTCSPRSFLLGAVFSQVPSPRALYSLGAVLSQEFSPRTSGFQQRGLECVA